MSNDHLVLTMEGNDITFQKHNVTYFFVLVLLVFFSTNDLTYAKARQAIAAAIQTSTSPIILTACLEGSVLF